MDILLGFAFRKYRGWAINLTRTLSYWGWITQSLPCLGEAWIQSFPGRVVEEAEIPGQNLIRPCSEIRGARRCAVI